MGEIFYGGCIINWEWDCLGWMLEWMIFVVGAGNN